MWRASPKSWSDCVPEAARAFYGVALALLLAASAQAQSATEAADDSRYTDDPLAEQDPLFVADTAFDTESAASLQQMFGDVDVWSDQVRGFSARDDVERLRGRLRLGWRGTGDSGEFAIAGKALIGSDDNRDNRRNNDNERSDALTLDQAFWRWLPTDSAAITLGKTEFALNLSPMLWDADLRPAGISAERRWSIRDFDTLRLVGGYFAGDHLYGDRSRIAAAQLGWAINPGAPLAFDMQLAWLQFSDLDEAVRQGLSRSNRRVGDRLVSDYRLLDLQLGVRWLIDQRPLSARIDLVRNTGADDLNEGVRASLVYGSARRNGGWEVGGAWQRIQRDAVLAAFNDDDWWFHSDARGFMPWVAFGWSQGWSARAAAFIERRDDSDETLKRLLLEVRHSF